MSQTYALLMDAYRELNAKKLFWITLVLSGLVILIIAAMGLDREGYSIFGWTIPLPFGEMFQYMTDEQLAEARASFYKGVFHEIGVTYWLTWAAIILAIISTAGLFPDLMTTGAIDTLLTKPISRLRLFLTKYMLGLGFVALQVAIFSICGFLVIGIRASAWDPTIFLAIPIVLLFFSYLYAVCVLIGVVTRSTLLAVLLTILAWFGMFIINYADSIILTLQAEAVVETEISEQRADYMLTLPNRPDPIPEPVAEQADSPGENRETEEVEPGTAQATANADSDVQDLDFVSPWGDFDTSTREGYAEAWGDESTLRNQAGSAREMAASLEKWRGYAFWVKTPLPKTGETRELMKRVLREETDDEYFKFDPSEDPEEFYGDSLFNTRMVLVEEKKFELSRAQRPWAWILLTSLLFELAVVGLAAWRFCRRDY